MSQDNSDHTNFDERRGSDRTLLGHSRMTAQITSNLDQTTQPVALLDVSRDGTGICLIIEAEYPPGSQLTMEVCISRGCTPDQYQIEVRHSDMLCPSFREMHLHGCRVHQTFPQEKSKARF
jgi:hypothetical protein